MKRKIKITSQQVKKVVLILLLVAVVGLLTYVTVDSFAAGRILSNSTAPNEISVTGEYKEYLDEHNSVSPSGYEFSVNGTNKALVAEFNATATDATTATYFNIDFFFLEFTSTLRTALKVSSDSTICSIVSL